MIFYIMVFLATFVSAINFALTKTYQFEEGNTSVLKMKPKIYGTIIGSAIISSISYMFQLECAKPRRLPATVQFPVLSGGTIIFSALLGLISFKEKISNRQAFSLLLCLASTIIFVL